MTMLRKHVLIAYTTIALLLLLTSTVSCTFEPEVQTPTPIEQQLTELAKTVSELKTQVNTLSLKTPEATALSDSIAKLQTQINTANALASNSLTEAQKATNTNTTTSANVAALTETVKTLQTSVKALQNTLATTSTVIGTTPINVGGLSVTFITNSVYLNAVGPTTPGIAQLAIKITNTTDRSLVNVDITGTITFSLQLAPYLASGYPTLTDGAGITVYNYYFNGSNAINFEAYTTGKTTLTIPKQGSITLRPRITLLSNSAYQIPATTTTVSLNTITYDIGQ